MTDHRTAFRLETDSAGSPIRYSAEIRTGAIVTIRLGGQRVRGRFATLARRVQGESAREYLLLPGVVVLEAENSPQVALALHGRVARSAGQVFSIPVLSPLEGTMGELQMLLESTSDSVTIAGLSRPARRWRLESPGGLVRTVWADAEGRVLRVTTPARALDAIRDDAPR